MTTQVRFTVNLLWHCLIFCEKWEGGAETKRGGAEKAGGGGVEKGGVLKKGGGGAEMAGGAEKWRGVRTPRTPPPLNPPVMQ